MVTWQQCRSRPATSHRRLPWVIIAVLQCWGTGLSVARGAHFALSYRLAFDWARSPVLPGSYHFLGNPTRPRIRTSISITRVFTTNALFVAPQRRRRDVKEGRGEKLHKRRLPRCLLSGANSVFVINGVSICLMQSCLFIRDLFSLENGTLETLFALHSQISVFASLVTIIFIRVL